MAYLANALEMPDGTKYEFVGKHYTGYVNASTSSLAYIQVNIDGFTDDSLVAGTKVFITFGGDRESADYLNVSRTGDKPIKYSSNFPESGAATVGNIMYKAWKKDETVEFTYDGTNWLIAPPRIWIGRCPTAGTVATKACFINGFVTTEHMKHGTIISIHFDDKQTITDTPYLMINGVVASVKAVATSFTQNNGSISPRIHEGINTFIYWEDIGGAEPRWIMIGTPVADSTNSTDISVAASLSAVNSLRASIPSRYNAQTQQNGYLTMSDLPIYDGTVE